MQYSLLQMMSQCRILSETGIDKTWQLPRLRHSSNYNKIKWHINAGQREQENKCEQLAKRRKVRYTQLAKRRKVRYI